MEKASTKDIKRMNKFLSGIHMGNSVFRLYFDEVQHEELKQLFAKISETFKTHEEKMTSIIEHVGGDPTDSLTVRESMSVAMESSKVKLLGNDFRICIASLKAVHMGIIGSIRFLHDNKELNQRFLDRVQTVLDDYRSIDDEIQSFLRKIA